MIWNKYLSTMEKNAIKTDDIATEDAYFMATHMPFSQLEVYFGGSTSSVPKIMNEDEIFDNLICNQNNDHRMIIVRGDNGTGKSHLIRYLKAKFENSSSTVYNPENEQLIFLRRLNNSVRGAFSQLVEQNVIKNDELREKIKKFIASSDAKDESSFKTDILLSYIAAVLNDKTESVYKPIICKNIAAFLSDSRVQEYLLREDGAIAKCYKIITSPSDQVLTDTVIFTQEDFNNRKILRSVIQQADPHASDFATTLKNDEDEINCLVDYLNKFTRNVVQRCADISSESTKTVFEQLRKDLKKQGKNLTLFIEDFTGFTGIDSELITVLSTEHGGDYSDLCRVTSIIGITNYYYDQFKDNFTDRVTHQISVTDRSYGTDNFLVQMAARYLNAIYCEPDELRKWYSVGANLNNLPMCRIDLPCEWEKIQIGNKEYTLFPFNIHSLLTLYNSLPVKSPRMFLKNVIRDQLKEYFYGKEYGDEWEFPLNYENIQMSKEQHSSAIDKIEAFSLEDKKRLKSIFAIWGDGTATPRIDSNGIKTIGGLDVKFLQDINLNSFEGIGQVLDESSGNYESIDKKSFNIPKIIEHDLPKSNTAQRVDPLTKQYLSRKEDINNWFIKNEPLKYHPDYRQYLRQLICGESNQCGIINWQDIGIPAFIAEERLADLGSYYIEGQDMVGKPQKVLVYLERSPESRDVLTALNEMKFAKGWDFEGSTYYQQCLITWLEKNKKDIVSKVASLQEEKMLPITEWCMVLQYIKLKVFGLKIDTSNPISIIQALFKEYNNVCLEERETKEWRDVVDFIKGKESIFMTAHSLLVKSSATTMGSISFSKEVSKKTFYRADELLKTVDKLLKNNWDIENELPDNIVQKNFLYSSAELLKTLYPKIKCAVEAEKRQANIVIENIESYLGDFDKDNILNILFEIQQMFNVFAINGIWVQNELREKYEREPIDNATKILKNINVFRKSNDSFMQDLDAFSSNSLKVITSYLNDFKLIEDLANKERSKAELAYKLNIGNINIENQANTIQEKLLKLYDKIQTMEVNYDAQ